MQVQQHSTTKYFIPYTRRSSVEFCQKIKSFNYEFCLNLRKTCFKAKQHLDSKITNFQFQLDIRLKMVFMSAVFGTFFLSLFSLICFLFFWFLFLLIIMNQPFYQFHITDYGRPLRKSPSLHSRKSTPTKPPWPKHILFATSVQIFRFL